MRRLIQIIYTLLFIRQKRADEISKSIIILQPGSRYFFLETSPQLNKKIVLPMMMMPLLYFSGCSWKKNVNEIRQVVAQQQQLDPSGFMRFPFIFAFLATKSRVSSYSSSTRRKRVENSSYISLTMTRLKRYVQLNRESFLMKGWPPTCWIHHQVMPHSKKKVDVILNDHKIPCSRS